MHFFSVVPSMILSGGGVRNTFECDTIAILAIAASKRLPSSSTLMPRYPPRLFEELAMIQFSK